MRAILKNSEKNNKKEIEKATEQLASLIVALLDEQGAQKARPEQPRRQLQDKGG